MRMVKIGEAAKTLGVTPHTLRKWEKTGQLLPDRKADGGTRYYDLDRIVGLRKDNDKPTLAYARVSSSDQKDDLDRQVSLLESFCASHGWVYEVITDLGSGLNYKKKGLQSLIDKVVDKETKRLVLTHKDRLLRFGAEIIFRICEKQGIEVVVINQSDDLSFEEELTQDVLEIITVFSAKLYGSRSNKHKEVTEAMKNAVSS